MRTCLSELELISQSLQGLVTVKTSSHKLTIIDSSFENDVAENNDIKQVNMGRTRTSEYSNILMYIMYIQASFFYETNQFYYYSYLFSDRSSCGVSYLCCFWTIAQHYCSIINFLSCVINL